MPFVPAFNRLNFKIEDGTDLLTGAAIGIGSALILTARYKEDKLILIPCLYRGDYRFGFL